MTEWEVVGVIVALVGLFLTVGAPIIKLITSITKLTGTVDALQKDMESLTTKNTEAHRRLWEHNEEQDDKINDHESRIRVIEDHKA